MPVDIHPTSVIASGASVGNDCQIGPFCFIGPNVTLGRGCRLQSHVSINGDTQLGECCYLGSFVSLGTLPAIRGETPKHGPLRIGNNTRILDQSTVGSGYKDMTVIGDDCLFMYATHIGHDSHFGNRVSMAALCCIGGHCRFGDDVLLSGQISVHQFVRVGRVSMISGSLAVTNDIPPFTISSGLRLARVATLNSLGLHRIGVTRAEVRILHRALWSIYNRDDGTLRRNEIAHIRTTFANDPLAMELIYFIDDSTRKRPMSLCLKRTDRTS